MEIFEIHVTEYTDTRMGGSNPSYKLTPCMSLETAKKAIKKFLSNSQWRKNLKIKVEDFDINLDKRGSWTLDFNPEIITVQKTKIK